MLRVRVPPEPSVTPSWSSLECSPLCHSGATRKRGSPRGSNPAGGAEVKRRHGTQTGKAIRLKPGDSVGSTPTRATDRDSSRRLAAKKPLLHTAWRRFESCRDKFQPAGLQVFRQHTSLVRRGTEIDSRADLRVNVRETSSSFSTTGCDPTGRPGFAHRKSGFDSPAVHSNGR